MYLVHWIFSPVFYLRIGKWFFEVALSGKEQPLLDKWFLAVKWKNKTFSFLQARPLARSPGLTNHRNSEFRTQKLPYTSAYTSTSIKNLWYFKCLLNVQTKSCVRDTGSAVLTTRTSPYWGNGICSTWPWITLEARDEQPYWPWGKSSFEIMFFQLKPKTFIFMDWVAYWWSRYGCSSPFNKGFHDMTQWSITYDMLANFMFMQSVVAGRSSHPNLMMRQLQ